MISKARIYFLIFFVGVCGFLVLARLYNLQVKKAFLYRALADNQHEIKTEIPSKRGEIFLKEKEGFFPVATNQKMATIFAVPNEIDKESADDLAEKLSQILGQEKEIIFQKITKEKSNYSLLKRKITQEEKEKILAVKTKGIYFFEEDWRFYPAGELASQVIGFVGYQDDRLEGMYGVERHFEEELRGEKGILEQEKDAGGRWISIGKKNVIPAKNGADIYLSIDRVIQFKAEMILKNAVDFHEAEGGKLVVMDPQNGKILAMAQAPTFDLNNYSSAWEENIFRNSLVSDVYECGSVFKTFTMAGGLDSGKVSPETTYFDSGQVSEAGFVIKNSDEKSYGEQTMLQVLEKSLNTGVIFVEKQIGNKKFLQYVENFGFGKETGIDLPHEMTGNLSNLKTNRDIEYFTASFGQGITVTPIQLASAYSAVANGGELLKPQIIDRIVYEDGKEEKYEKEFQTKVISKNTANQLALMLENNVINGHGKKASVPGYRIGGKTGTAQIADKQKGGYLEDATTGTFAGFGPIENPRFVIVAIIDYPKGVQWAESTAGPVFGELAKFILEYYGIEPTQEYDEKDIQIFNSYHNYSQEKEIPIEKKED